MAADLWTSLQGALAAVAAFLGLAGAPADPGWLQGYGEGEYLRIAAPVEGQLLRLDVERGQQVGAGAPLFALDTTLLAADRAAAAAELAAARSDLADLRKGERDEELQARAARAEQASADLAYWSLQVGRLEQLVKTNAAARERLDEARSTHDRKQAELDEMQASLAAARLGGRSDRIAAAESRVAAAEAALARAERRLVEQAPVAPAAARVEDTFFRPGERVPADRAVVSLLPPENRKIRFFVPEPLLPRFVPGTDVTWRCDGCPDGLVATVRFVADQAEFTPPVIYSIGSRERLVYRVEAWPAPDGFLPRPGQPVDVAVPGA
ncbi:MAG: HlyD family efflux transporter periplasmic adaptor subunit [Geminicoccaceae bacterium]